MTVQSRLLWIAVALVVWAALPFVVPRNIADLLVFTGIYTIAGLGIGLLLGHCGIVNLAQANDAPVDAVLDTQGGEILRRFWEHLAPGGRAIIGFGTDRGYAVDTFREHAESAGFDEDLLLSTWDLRPYAADSDFIVAILRRGGTEPAFSGAPVAMASRRMNGTWITGGSDTAAPAAAAISAASR